VIGYVDHKYYATSFCLGLVGNRNLPETKKMLRYLGIQLYAGFTMKWSPLGGRNSKKALKLTSSTYQLGNNNGVVAG
jgi:hypothetical protein